MRTLVMLGLLSVLCLITGLPVHADPTVAPQTEPVRAFPLRRAPAAVRMMLLSQFLRHSSQNHFIATGEIESDVHTMGYTVRPFHWPVAQNGATLIPAHWELEPTSPGVYLSPVVNEHFYILLIDSDGSEQRTNDLPIFTPPPAQADATTNKETLSLAGIPREEIPTHELIRYSTEPRDRAVDQWRTEALHIFTEHFRLTGSLPIDWKEGLALLRLGAVGYSSVTAEPLDWAVAHGRGQAGVMIETDITRGLIRATLWLADRKQPEVELYKIWSPPEGQAAMSFPAGGPSITVEMGPASSADLNGAVFTPLVYAGIHNYKT